MAITEATVTFTAESLAAIQRVLDDAGLDGWLLYDFRGINPVATGLLGLPPLTRRFFVFIPARGTPIALTHRIEQQPWRGWIGENRPYLGWESLERALARVLRGARTVALEYSEGDAVPYLDRVPAGVLELVTRSGAQPVSSADLVSAFYSRWSPEGEASHRRAAALLASTVRAAFARVGARIHAADAPTEWDMREWIVSQLVEGGLAVGADAIVAVNANAGNPHYAPSAEQHSLIGPGDLVLIDLWGKESADAVYADQTWMAYVGERVPGRIQALWEAILEARDAAVDLLDQRWREGREVAGYEVDQAARDAIARRGLAEAFIHRTGHSIDRDLHGSGPNIDNLETRDVRRLIEGVGFSIEPGVYLAGDLGLRTEIDVFMSPEGPIVTTPEPQRDIHLIRI